MRHPKVVPFVLITVWGVAAAAYEGAGAHEEAAEPPKVPQLTKPPALVKSVEAAYPEALAKAGVGGEVVLVLDIDAAGKVPRVEVSKGSGEPALDAAAKAALLQFEFSPAEIDGKPGAIRLEYLYRFTPPPPPVVKPPEPDAPKEVNLRGRVLERGTRDPVVGATVFVTEGGLVTETDERGAYALRGVPAGPVHVRIDEAGHRRFETEVEIAADEITELDAYVWKKIEGGFETTVRGEREKKEVSRHTLAREELTSVPGTFGDPLRVLQNLPGMSRGAYVSGALLVRGAQPQDTGVYIDGLPIPPLYHFGGGPSVVNPSFIDRIDFFPGAYGARYGRAIAGVVDVATREPSPKALHGNVDVDLLDAGFFLEGPVKQGDPRWGSWAVAGRRSYIDVFLPTLIEATRTPGTATFIAAPRYWDYQARYDVNVSGNRFEAVVFGSDDTLRLAQAGDAETSGISLNTTQGFHRARVKWGRTFGDGWKVSLAPGFGTTWNATNLDEDIKIDLGSWDWLLRGTVNKEFSKTLSFEAGLDLARRGFDVTLKLPGAPKYYTFPGENPDTPITERSFSLAGSGRGVYAEAIWSPMAGLKLVPGLRFESYALPKEVIPSVEPRLAARYELRDGTALKAAWGLFRQNPDPNDLDEDFGNPYLGLEKSSQTVVGFEQRLADKLSLDVQAFYNWRSDLVIGSSDLVERDGKQVIERLKNGGTGMAYGLEVLLKQDLTERMYGWIAYTLSRSEQMNQQTGKYQPVSFDQTHLLTIVGSYKWDGGWETGLRFRLTTGRPVTPIIGSTYDADTNGYRPLRGEAGSERGPLFHQLDLRVEKLFTFESWRLSAYLDVQNVYNAENPEQILWDYRYREQAPLRGLPILPTLGVTGAF